MESNRDIKGRALAAAREAMAVGSSALKSTAGALDSSAKFVESHKGRIVDVARKALDAAADVSQGAGTVLAQQCSNLADKRSKQIKLPRTALEKMTDTGAGRALEAGELLGRTINRFSQETRKASPAIGAAASGLIAGAVAAVSSTLDAVAITQADFDDLERRLVLAGAEARARAHCDLARMHAAERSGNRGELLDLLVISGVTLASMIDDPTVVPAEVEEAFTLAYPGLAAAGATFADTAAELSTAGLVGLVNGVKGKLFELELVDQLNDGGLADGLHAELAGSVTQPGYDIRILDSDGNAVDVLQAKATESVAYLREALDRYPTIDIATTSEVHGYLMALGLTERVTDSGIAEAALQQKVEAAAGLGADFDLGDFVPSALGVAVIAFSAFSDSESSWEERGAEFGERTAKATVAGAAATAALIATHAIWLAVPAGIGMRILSRRGDAKRQRYDALKGIVDSLEAERYCCAANGWSSSRMA